MEYGKCRDKLFRETGEAISKENFLRVYGEAHLKVLQPDLIKTAFRKTGIIPFNRDVITAEMLAPSKNTAFRYFTPIEPTPAVRIMTDLMVDVLQPVIDQQDEADNTIANPRTTSRHLFPIRTALPELLASDVGYLASGSPIKASTEPPDLETILISPIKHIRTGTGPAWAISNDLRTIQTATVLEKAFQDALNAKDSEARFYKSQVTKLQSMMVLQRLYCQRVRRQLNAKEKKDEKKEKKGGRINGDGLPRLLTSDEFLEVLEVHEAAAEKAERSRLARLDLRAEYEAELEEWEIVERGRKERNIAGLQRFKDASAAWDNERKAAKAKGTKLKDWDKIYPKHKQKDFVEKGIPKPKLRKVVTDDGDDGDDVDVGAWSDEDDEDDGIRS